MLVHGLVRVVHAKVTSQLSPPKPVKTHAMKFPARRWSGCHRPGKCQTPKSSQRPDAPRVMDVASERQKLKTLGAQRQEALPSCSHTLLASGKG